MGRQLSRLFDSLCVCLCLCACMFVSLCLYTCIRLHVRIQSLLAVVKEEEQEGLDRRGFGSRKAVGRD